MTGETGLPRRWTLSRLEDVAHLQLGKMLDKARPKGSPHKYLRNINVRWDAVDTTDLLSMAFQDDELERFSIRDGDLLVCEGGEPGRAAVWKYGPTDLRFQKALHRVRFLGRISARWAMYQLMLDASTGRLARGFTGSTIAHLPREKLAEYRLRVAPHAEQERIVDAVDSYVSRLDAAIATLEAAQAKLKAYSSSVLKSAVAGRLVPTEASLARAEKRDFEPADVLLKRILSERRRLWEEVELARLKAAGKSPSDDKWKAKYEDATPPDKKDLPELPEGWCWASVEQLTAEVFYGTSAKTGPEAEVPVLRMGNLVDGELDLTQLKFLPGHHTEFPALLLQPGDILFNRTNSAELVGKTAVYKGRPAPCSFASYLICARPLAEVEPQWLAHTLNSTYGRLWVSSVVVQQVGQANVNGTKLKAFSVPLPPAPEQSRLLAMIETHFSNVDDVARTLTREVRRGRRLTQAVLKWAFEGKLVDQDPTDEPADTLLERIRAERANTEAPKRTRRARKAQ